MAFLNIIIKEQKQFKNSVFKKCIIMISEYCSITHLFTAENNKHLLLLNYIQANPSHMQFAFHLCYTCKGKPFQRYFNQQI
jgi:hypothetical protein